MAASQMENYNKVEQGRRVGLIRQPTQGSAVWQPSEEGTIKLNWDAALDGNSKKMGYGIVSRDSKGRVIAAMCGSKANITNPSIAEVVGA
jgi:hypothetical protein